VININGFFLDLLLPRNNDLYLDNVIYAIRKGSFGGSTEIP